MSSIKIIDYIIYNGDLITPYRLKYLYNVIDEFVIIEARYTHTNILKPFLYKDKNYSDFEPYIDKCKFIIVDKFPEVENDWKKLNWMHDISSHSFFREKYQRNAGREYVIEKYKNHKYFVICSDVDEIPNINLIISLNNNYSI